VEVYTTETDQINAIKHFFVNNGKYLAVGIVLGIGAIVGWNYWQSHQTNQLQDTATAYEKINTSLASGSKEGITAAEKFANETNNIYGVITDMQLAKHAVDENNLAQAEKYLLLASGKTKDPDMLALTNIRLARVQLAEDKTDAALKTLEQVKSTGWQVAVNDLRGDILAKKGNIKGAREAYSSGLTAQGSQALKMLMQIKLDNLSN
jgi:predicted negative regulator of RcsB-dependent stress response